jgi:hypothetical protein
MSCFASVQGRVRFYLFFETDARFFINLLNPPFSLIVLLRILRISCLKKSRNSILRHPCCGCSSVVEHHVANVRVVSSSLITRYRLETVFSDFFAGVAQW